MANNWFLNKNPSGIHIKTPSGNHLKVGAGTGTTGDKSQPSVSGPGVGNRTISTIASRGSK